MSNRPPTVSNSFKSRQIEITEKLTVTGNISSTGPMVIDTSSSNAALRVTQRGSGNVIEIEDSANPDSTPFVVNNAGQLVMGTLSAFHTRASLVISATGNDEGGNTNIALRRVSNTQTGSEILFFTSRGDFTNYLPLSDNDIIGGLRFQGFVPQASGLLVHVDPRGVNVGTIRMEVDGVPNLSSIPSRLTFSTAVSGTIGSTEKMRIDNAGNVGIGTTAPNELLTVAGNISSTGTMVIDTSSSNAALRVTQRGEGNVIEIEDETNPDSSPFVVTNTGQLIIGLSANRLTTTPLSLPWVGESLIGGSIVTISDVSPANSPISGVPNGSIQLYRFSSDNLTTNPAVNQNRARGTISSPLPVLSGDRVGGHNWQGFDGEKFIVAANIRGEIDGTPSLSSMPGRILFTTNVGGGGVTERMRITSLGNIGIGTTAPNERLTVAGNISATGDINTSGRILSGGVDLFDLFTSSELASGIQTLSYVPSSYELSISLGNTVSLSSLNTSFLDTTLEYLSTSNVAISSIVSETITVSTLNVPVTVITVSGTRVFTDSDSNKVIHFDTTSASVCAVFPSSLTNGFNLAIMNTGINSVVLSSSVPLKATGTTIIDQYGGAFIYKQNNDIFAVGRLY